MEQKKLRIVSQFIVLAVILQCFPQPVFAFNLNDLHPREYFRTQVERSDRFIQNAETKVNHSMQKTETIITKLTQGGFSLFEKRTGVTEDNKLYQVAKNSTLRKTGIKLGAAEGTKNFVIGTVSLLAQLNTLPARTINLAYNVKEKPQEYKEKAVTGVTVLAGAMANPKLILRSVQQSWQKTVAEAQKDPLKMGKLQGEIAVFCGTLFVGGGQAKTATKAGGLLEKVAKTGSLAKRDAGAGILTRATASINKIDLGAIIPDIPQLNIGYLSVTPAMAGTGKAASVSISGPTTKGILTAPKTVSAHSSYPLSMSVLEEKLVKASYDLPMDTVNQILDWARNTYTKWAQKLSENDAKIIKDYTWGSTDINKYLRGKPRKELTVKEMGMINRLSVILHTAPPLKNDIVVFRAGSNSILGDLAELPHEKLVGKVLHDKGFLSTSLLPDQVEFFAEDVFTVINVPKRTKGAFVGELSILPEEREFLLDKGQQMFIKKAIQGDKYLIMELDLL